MNGLWALMNLRTIEIPLEWKMYPFSYGKKLTIHTSN